MVAATTSVTLRVATMGQAPDLMQGYQPMSITEAIMRDPDLRPYVVHPSDAEYERSAPAAEALVRAAATCAPGLPPGDRRDFCALRLLERPADEAGAALEARLRWGYKVVSGDAGPCLLDDELRIPLPPGPTVEERLRGALGEGPRRLAAILDAAR